MLHRMRRAHYFLPSFLALLSLCGCGGGNANGGGVGAPAGAGAAAPAVTLSQRFEITVDGNHMTLSPDDPAVSQVLAALVDGDTKFTLSALDRSKNLSFALTVKSASVGLGSYSASACGFHARCQDPESSAELSTYPDSSILDPNAGSEAYDYPELGLTPAVLTISKIEDVQRPGVGPCKHVQGSFKGDFAFLQQNRSTATGDEIVGPVHHVQGSFDLYAILR